MKRQPAFAKVFKRRWRIVEMDNWPDDDDLNLVEPAHITFKGSSDGEIAFRRAQGLARRPRRNARRFRLRRVLLGRPG